jgi:hypothetical protein
MKAIKFVVGLGLLALLMSAPTGQRAGGSIQAGGWTVPEVIRSWPQRSQVLVKVMLEEYGEASLVEDDAVIWLNNGPWRKTIVYRTAPYHAAGAPDMDYLQQTIGYAVPADKVADLKLFNKRLEVDPVAGELSSCSDSEGSNYLALNLADEVVQGERGVHDAQEFYSQSVRLAAAGKSSPYTEGLLRPAALP